VYDLVLLLFALSQCTDATATLLAVRLQTPCYDA
jgi:hypothetical protein